ncbi:FtsX-like permease family protein [Rummeliibacillus sp. JY-2-4R]
MKLSTLVIRSMRKNIKHYYLYFFALIFSAALYFSFVTLQHNEAVVKLTHSSMKGEAGFKVGSILLLIIVFFFVFYANQLFLKRRSKEIGLYQMIGIPKTIISYMLTFENLILWVGATLIGILIGFFFSRFFALIFLKVIDTKREVALDFSIEALLQTIIVFAILLIVVLLQTMWVIHRTSLLDLFKATSKAELKLKKMNPFQILLGLLGIALIIYGYYVSTTLFEMDKTTEIMDLYIKMGTVLGCVILGTFLVFRYSISFIMNMIRMSRKGHLSLNDVLSITSIMHRMKSNVLSLTIITILTALALAILSLSYISYYSVDAKTEQLVPYDMSVINSEEKANGKSFEKALQRENIEYKINHYDLLNVQIDVTPLLKEKSLNQNNLNMDNIVIRESDAKQIIPKLHLKKDEAIMSGYSDIMQKFIPFEVGKKMILHIDGSIQELTLVAIEKQASIPSQLTYALPAIIIKDDLFNQLQKNKAIQTNTVWKSFNGYTITNKQQMDKANSIYKETTNEGTYKAKLKDGATEIRQFNAKHEDYRQTLESMGLLIFITGFLGMAFLFATGSILYFKQMTEAEEERGSFLTLQKIGFSTDEIMKGIHRKQLFSFGLPLIIGICHSYFAVKSGWMLFGTELVVPLLITMAIYILLYSIFAILTTKYYRKIINELL